MNVTIIISRLTCLLFLSAPSLMSMNITNYVMSYCFGNTTNIFYNELQNKFASLEKNKYNCNNMMEYLKPESDLTAFCRMNREIARIGSNTIETQTLAKLTPERSFIIDYEKNLIISCENKKLIIECNRNGSDQKLLEMSLLENIAYSSDNEDKDLEKLKNWTEKIHDEKRRRALLSKPSLSLSWRFHTPLMFASSRGRLKIVKFLLQYNTKKTIENDNLDGVTALMFAGGNYNSHVIEKLLKHGANINHQDKYGMTALMYASKCGNYLMVEFYIKNGADVSLKDNKGKTALDWAYSSAIFRILERETLSAHYNVWRIFIGFARYIENLFFR